MRDTPEQIGRIDSSHRGKWLDYVAPLLAFLCFWALWWLSIAIFGINPIILPSPGSVLYVLRTQFLYLSIHAWITLLEAVLGFVLGGSAALLLSTLFTFSPLAERALYPYAIAFKAIPLVALAPLLAVWFGTGVLTKVVMSAIISFFPILVNAAQGFQSVDSDALDLMESMSASRLQIFTKLRFPTALPAIFSGMRVSSTFAVIGAVVAEFVGASQGIGYVVKTASYYVDSALLFASIVFASLTGILFFGVVVLVERRIVFWAK